VEDRSQDLGDEIRRRLGAGVALEPSVRERFEGRLGSDLSGVMVHRSPLAGHLARVFGAQALTTGEHVLGMDEDLDTGTPEGEALLGHELTHVVQRVDDEPAAQAMEQSLLSPSGAELPGAAIDADMLAELVYQRLLRELQSERERAAGTWW
jgi:Domain of unknown function (DUF4157)